MCWGFPMHDKQGQEYLAGWTDGVIAARGEMRNAMIPELARYGLWLDDANDVVERESDRVSLFEPDVVPEPDNPDGNEVYARAFEDGREASREHVLKKARVILVEHDLFAGDDGAIVPTDLVSFFVSWYRGKTKPARVRVTDQSLHAFLDDATAGMDTPNVDGDLSVSSSANAALEEAAARESAFLARRSVGTEPAPPPRTFLRRTWTMVKKSIDRRTAVTVLTGAVLSGTALGWFFWGDGKLSPQRSPQERAQSLDSIPPTPAHWQYLSPNDRLMCEGIHAWLSTEERAGNKATVVATLDALMSGTNDQPKQFIAKYVRDLRRGDLAASLALGLGPHTGAQLRLVIAGSVEILAHDLGGAAIPRFARDRILAYARSGQEPDPECRAALTRVVAVLK